MANNTNRRRTVICKKNEHGTMDFYLIIDSECLFLFRTRYYSKEVFQKYQSGKTYEEVLSYTPKKRRYGVAAKRAEKQKIKIKERIAQAIKYIEHEYEQMAFDGGRQKAA